MSEEEHRFLEEISNSAGQTTENIRASLSGRINSYILTVSFVALAEATITAAFVAKGLDPATSLFARVLGFTVFASAFVFVGLSAYQIFKLFHINLSSALFPNEAELPYCSGTRIAKDIEELEEVEPELFTTPLDGSGCGYEDIDALYRKWVFQKVQILNHQYESIAKVKRIFLASTVFMAISVVLVTTGSGLMVFFF